MLTVPRTHSLLELKQAARDCERCDLYKNATQTVFGEGPTHAAVVAVGEQPGDYEDQQGKPFVGPAGRILTRAFEESGLDAGEGLYHQRGEALQIRDAGEKAHSQKTGCYRNLGVPAMALRQRFH